MKPPRVYVPRFVSVLFAALVCAAAPAFAGQPGSTQMEQTLYVQAPDFAGGNDSIVLAWIPEPIESVCSGRTLKRCVAIDFCIRTTNPNDAMCKNLGIPRARLPHYPPNMMPRRVLIVVLRKPGNGNGFALLKEFYRNAPKATLERLSPEATIRAGVRYNDDPSFEGFTLLEVLSVPPH